MAWGPEEAFAKKLKFAVPHRGKSACDPGGVLAHPTPHSALHSPNQNLATLARGNFHSQDPKLTFADEPALLYY